MSGMGGPIQDKVIKPYQSNKNQRLDELSIQPGIKGCQDCKADKKEQDPPVKLGVPGILFYKDGGWHDRYSPDWLRVSGCSIWSGPCPSALGWDD